MKANFNFKLLIALITCIVIGTNLLYAYEIEVEIEGLENEYLFLGFHYGPDFKIIDTTQTNSNGYAVFKAKENLPVGVYFIVIPPQTHFDFLVTDTKKIKIKSSIDDLLGDLSIESSKQTKLFCDMQKEVAELNMVNSMLDIKKQYFKASQQVYPDEVLREEDSLKNKRKLVYEYYKTLAGKNTYLYKMIDLMLPVELPNYVQRWQTEDPKRYYYYYKDHYFDDVDFSDNDLLRTPEFVFHRKLIEYTQYFVNNRADSIDAVFKDIDGLISKTSKNIEFEKYILSFLIDKYENSAIMGMDTLFIYLADNYFLSNKLKWVDKTAQQLIKERRDELIYTSLGKTAKDLVLKTIDNKQINLHDIDSKFLVVWFWEPDCDICDELTISLNQNRAELNKIGAKILAINIGSEQEKWINYTRDNDLQFINTWNSEAFNDFQKYYGANRTPRLYVLNADKKILAKDLQPAGLPKYIQYLNKNN